jgi:hypothetical protein
MTSQNSISGFHLSLPTSQSLTLRTLIDEAFFVVTTSTGNTSFNFGHPRINNISLVRTKLANETTCGAQLK